MEIVTQTKPVVHSVMLHDESTSRSGRALYRNLHCESQMSSCEVLLPRPELPNYPHANCEDRFGHVRRVLKENRRIASFFP